MPTRDPRTGRFVSIKRNAGRRKKRGKAPFAKGDEKLMQLSKDELVRMGTAASKAELARRGRAPDGMKLAWKAGKKAKKGKKAAANPWWW